MREAAQADLARVRLLAAVQARVQLEAALPLERLRAQLAPVHLAAVDARVLIQVAAARERLRAAVARERARRRRHAADLLPLHLLLLLLLLLPRARIPALQLLGDGGMRLVVNLLRIAYRTRNTRHQYYADQRHILKYKYNYAHNVDMHTAIHAVSARLVLTKNKNHTTKFYNIS